VSSKDPGESHRRGKKYYSARSWSPHEQPIAYQPKKPNKNILGGSNQSLPAFAAKSTRGSERREKSIGRGRGGPTFLKAPDAGETGEPGDDLGSSGRKNKKTDLWTEISKQR